jgi:hypothetical protein
MLPEISRRCLTCGAAVRAGSRFCQQCGKALEAEARPVAGLEAEAAGASVPATGEWPPQEQTAPPAKDWTPPTKEFAAFEQSAGVAEPRAASPAHTPVVVEPSDEEVGPEATAAVTPELSAEAARASDEAGEAERAGELRGRVARVREGTRARVGRMREEAIVVLEETPDDSGLRFVLAAAALFVLFIVLLFLSTTVLR